jgi:hypothetical protein
MLVVVAAVAAAVVGRAWAGGEVSGKSLQHRRQAAKKAESAYAFVVPGEVSLNVNPVLVAARSSNIQAVTSPAVGVFCLTPAPGIDPTAVSWTVTPEVSRSSAASGGLFAYPDASPGTCPAGQFAVRTYELSTSGAGATAVPSEHVAFMVVVP